MPVRKLTLSWKVALINILSVALLLLLTFILAIVLSNLFQKYGIKARLEDLFTLGLLSTIIAVPAGILAGIILEEYFPPFEQVKPVPNALINFSALPSIVYALLGLTVLTGLLNLNGSLLTGSLTLAICIAPVMIQSTRMAIRAVPREMHTAALALGASRWQRIRYTIIPFAMTAIVSGVIRAFAVGIGLAGPLVLLGALISGSRKIASAHEEIGKIPVEVKDAMVNTDLTALESAKVLLILLIVSVVLNWLAIRMSRRSLLRRTVFRSPD